MNNLLSKKIEHILLLFLGAWVLSGACTEFYNIAWGTGNWVGQFSFKWFLFFIIFILFCLACLGWLLILVWAPEKTIWLLKYPSKLRAGLKPVRWLLIGVILFLPAYLFEYTPWGLVFDELNLRKLIWALSAVLIGWLLSVGSDQLFRWKELLIGLVLTSGVYIFFSQLLNITNYPFSLGWSEGNRLWDYSILF